MVPRTFLLYSALSLGWAGGLTLAHGHDEGGGGDGMAAGHAAAAAATAIPSLASSTTANATTGGPDSYFSNPDHASLILAHIVLMTVAWLFVLPIGVMLSIARSRLALMVQLTFLGIHALATVLGLIYRRNTPDLYEKNVHRPVGWIITGLVVAQCVMELLKLASDAGSDTSSFEERTSLLPVTIQALQQHHRQQNQRTPSPDPYRFSGDSAHFTASEPSRSQSVSSTATFTQEEQQKLHEYEATQEDKELRYERRAVPSKRMQRAADRMAATFSKRTLLIMDLLHNLINRTIFLFGFLAFVSGLVVYGGVFHGIDIFNGVAHTIKGGIFFWYGLLTLGRWMGCFAEYGWAWNVRPPVGVVSSRQARLPSAEFVESFVIWLYGASNVFLEHLAAWGKPWTPMDLEHLSITIMFFGGGMCGMLIESTWIRDLLNSVMLLSSAGRGPQFMREKLQPPKNYAHSMNPLPALIILLLGLMMSSHHQQSMISTMIHKQWGTLFIGFALARAVTYILIFLAPPTSYLPSRPPSELISAFCLISGGLIFMASNRNTVESLEAHEIHAMFPFTVVMGFTAFLMAWTVILLAIKGWAVRRNPPKTSPGIFTSVAA